MLIIDCGRDMNKQPFSYSRLLALFWGILVALIFFVGYSRPRPVVCKRAARMMMRPRCATFSPTAS